jgi:pimeloyl-ACP methyl ester carboxylesterase
MNVTINDCALNVEVMGPEDGPVLIAHHGGGGIGSLAEPKATFGPLADRFRVVVFDAREDLKARWAAQTIADLMPNAKLVVFEKSGHSPQIEERELFLSTVRDFLDGAVS